jgi:hypothetical protein
MQRYFYYQCLHEKKVIVNAFINELKLHKIVKKQIKPWPTLLFWWLYNIHGFFSNSSSRCIGEDTQH